MNMITKLIERVSDFYATNKNPCKSYKTEASAEKKAVEYASKLVNYFDVSTKEVEYVVFFVPDMNRWTVAYNLVPLLNKRGGYVGIASELGFFSY